MAYADLPKIGMHYFHNMKQGLFIFILFGTIGIALVCWSVYLVVHTHQFKTSAIHVPGTVITLIPRYDDGDTTYAPEVTFTAQDGSQHTFTSGASTNPPAFYESEEVDVMYEPNNPSHAKINSFSTLYTLPLITGGIGTVFALVGIIPGTLYIRRKKQITFLKQFGMRIHARVTEIEYRQNYKVNNKSPYRIWAEGIDPRDGTTKKFKSDNIWIDPHTYIKKGDSVEILVHPQQSKMHYMETPFLSSAPTHIESNPSDKTPSYS